MKEVSALLSVLTIKLYYGGHFDTSYSKFIEYEIDYYDFCDVDKMSVFEVGAIVSKSVDRKSVGATLYFKSPKEGMEKLGELENDRLPIGVAQSSGSYPPIVVIDDVDNEGYTTDYSSSSEEFVYADKTPEHPPKNPLKKHLRKNKKKKAKTVDYRTTKWVIDQLIFSELRINGMRAMEYRGEKTESGNGCSYYTIFHLRPLLTRGLSMQWRIGHYIRIDRIEIIERLNIMDARSLGLIDLMGSDRTENRNIEGFGHNAGRRGIVDFGPLIWVRNKEYCSEAAAETQTDLAVNSRNPTISAYFRTLKRDENCDSNDVLATQTVMSSSLPVSLLFMSSSATIVNDREHGDCAQQPSTATGRLQGTQRQLLVKRRLTSADVDPVAAAAMPVRRRTPSTPDVEQGTGTTSPRRPSQRKRQPPITAAEPGTGAENMRRTKQRATPTAALQSSTRTEIFRGPSQMRTHTPIAAVEPGTSAGNTRRTKQRTTPTAAVQLGNGPENSRHGSQRRTAAPIAAVEPGTGADDMRRTKKRTTATTAVQSGRRKRNSTHKRAKSSPRMTDEEESDAEEDNNKPKRQPIFERDLTPEQRDIPDTELLHGLGYHLSAYARAGLFWAFEYLDISRPEHHDVDVFPRARRWICAKGSSNNDSTLFLASRCKLNYVEESQVTWQPYLSSAIYGSNVVRSEVLLSRRRVPFQGISTWEYYLGERCRRQLGFPCQVPNDPPQMMHGPPKDRPGYVPENVPADTLVKEGLDYASWFANNSIGNILNVTRSLGGPEIAGKVIDQWLAKHEPNLIPMRRKVTGEIGALTGFWQFLPFWAFEYLDISRPEHHDVDVFPRARRWICAKGSSNNDSTLFLASRCKLNYVEESQVTWQPYLSSAIYGSNVVRSEVLLSRRRVPFQGISTWEYYLGERCRRQLGFPCQVPNDPPQMMHGPPKDRPGYVPENVPADTLVKEGLDYASWFANNSIGNILNVTRSLGGPEIAGKVIDQWLAKHEPNLIPVEQSQYEKIKEDRNALEEECAKLREELKGQGSAVCIDWDQNSTSPVVNTCIPSSP
uniref:Uncharacterized protein n=1 Tax=Daucus carota subsp. sativus TaxID=79200 RepID=A0A162A701_DAUCS